MMKVDKKKNTKSNLRTFFFSIMNSEKRNEIAFCFVAKYFVIYLHEVLQRKYARARPLKSDAVKTP